MNVGKMSPIRCLHLCAKVLPKLIMDLEWHARKKKLNHSPFKLDLEFSRHNEDRLMKSLLNGHGRNMINGPKPNRMFVDTLVHSKFDQL